MRELDTETPVIWPAWCYQSGEITSESSPQTASSPSLQISPHAAASANGNLSNSENHKNARAKRKPIHNTLQYSVDKMLNERNKLIENNKNILHSNNNNNYNNNLMTNNNSCVAAAATNVIPFGDKLIKNTSDSNMNFIKNGQLSPSTAQKLSQITLNKCLSNGTSINNKLNSSGSVKTERLSPPLVNDLSIYRSRSVTPQSSAATPPQQPNNMMSNPNISSLLSASTTHLGNGSNSGNTQRQELPPLNYSDMMRTLAAKYNNSNDLSTPKNSFIESRMKTNREPLASMDKKPNSPPQIPPNQNLLTSLFSSLQFNQNNIFNPMLDMGSTRALVLLARAAQEAEMQTLIKEADKPHRKLSNLNNNFPSTSTQMPNLGSFNSFNPFPALSNLQALHQLSTRSPPAPPATATTTITTTQVPYQSPISENPATGISPLDLSSSSTPPLAKRIKLSPTTTTEAVQRQQQTKSPNVTTTNNQLSTSALGFSTTSSSSSSSTTSNNSEQTTTGTAQQQQQQPTRKCQMKIDEINSWNVNEVCSFVEGIAICAEYVNNFREQSIDGESLMMLTEEHLINILGMKLGPALKLRSKLLKRLNEVCNCSSCSSSITSNGGGDENLLESKSFINNFTKMKIPRSGSTDSVKF